MMRLSYFSIKYVPVVLDAEVVRGVKCFEICNMTTSIKTGKCENKFPEQTK